MTGLRRLSRGTLALLVVLASALAQAPPAEAAGPTCTTSSAGANTVQLCLTAPAAGSTLTGPTTVSATATVTAGAATVVSVTFLLDGSGLLTDPRAGFAFTWHTAHWVDGPHTLGTYVQMSDGSDSSAHPTTESVSLSNGITSPPINTNSPTIATGTSPPAGQPKIVAAVGDSAGGDSSATTVANEIGGMSPNLFLYLGDVYEQGSYEEFQNWYESIYGPLKGITSPTPGNHEWADYAIDVNGGYEWYWNNLPTYYSFDTAGWHFISLNGNSTASNQQTWLANDLATHAGACTIAYWHQPYFALSGAGDPTQQGLWTTVANAHATLVLNGHEHNYQRWTPMDATGKPSPTGTAEIIAGSGGHHIDEITSADSRAVTSLGGEFGALKLSLTATAVGFQFVKTDGTVFDSGSLPCQGSGGIAGTVSDVAAGHAIAGASVAYSGTGPNGPVSGSTTTNASGQYSVSGLPATSLTVTVSATAYSTQRANLTVGGAATATQNFIYPPPVSGTVADAISNQPISGVPISYSGGSTTTDASGSFTLAGTTPGTYSVTASPQGYISQTQNVTVTSGTTTVVTFLCSLARGSISGSVTDAAMTRNLSGASVSYSGGSTTTNASGQFSLSNVVPGTYAVTTGASGYVTQSQTVTVTSGNTSTQNFALNPAAGTTPIFSDGFESGSLSSWSGPMGFTVETTTVHAGAYAAEGKTTNGQTHAFKIFSSGYSNLYYRVYFNVKSQSSAFTLFGVQASSVSSIARLYLTGTGQLMLVNDSAGLSWFGPTVSPAAWHAGEIHVVINGTSSTIEVWLDGTSVSVFNQTTDLGTAPVDTIRLGELNAGLTYDVAYDDATASTSRVGLGPTTITGTVTDAGTGQPVSGATVSYSGGGATTNASGQYTLQSVAPGGYSITAAAGGYTSQSATTRVAAGNTATANFALAVAPGAIAGTVTDVTSKQPISGAQVVYTSLGVSGSANTNASGQYSLTGVPAGTYTTTASANGYTGQSKSVTVSAGNTTTQNFTIGAALASVSGQVTDASSGLAIAGATVSYSGGSTTTNSSGQYTLANVVGGTYPVTASAPGYAAATQSVTVAAGASVTQNFVLAPNPGSISGTVTDASTGQPLSAASVSDSGGSTTTNAQGLYTLTNVAEGTVTLTASATNYASRSQTVSVGAGASVTQNFALTPNPGTVSGTVTDATTKQPIGGATVSYSGGSTSTTAQGQYSFTNVAEGSYTVTAAAAAYASQSQTVTVTAGAAATQDFTLTPNPGTVSGTVIDALTSRPILGATVSFSGGSTTTNAQGAYTLTNVPEGTMTVTSSQAGYTSQSTTVTVGAGATVIQSFSLVPNPGTISGTITDASTNLPLGGATVSYSGGSATTNAQGQYALTNVPEGSYPLTATAANYVAQTQSLTVFPGGASTGNFALAPNPGSVRGTLTDATTKQPISGATVSYSGGSVTADAFGVYTLTGVAEGSYTVTATATGYGSQSQAVSVGPGATVTQDFALAPNPGTITGVVTDAVTNQPVNGATVSYSGGSVTTDAVGRYTLANVPEGTIAVTTSATGFTSQSQNVTVGPGASVTRNVALTPNPATFTGTVTDAATKQAIAGASLTYSGGSATTNGQGQFTLTGVTEGVYTLTASAAGYASQSQTVTASPGATTTQNFSLVASPGTISGTVSDAATNGPISGATVTYSGGGGATTNASGQYTLTNVAPGTSTLTAAAPGYASQNLAVTVAPGASLTQNFALAPNPAAISGTVIDSATNQPIYGAAVSDSGGSTTTNAAGQYTFSNVVEGTYTVTATSGGYTGSSKVVIVPPGAVVTQNFALTPNPGALTGTVIDAATNTALSGASVTYAGGSATTDTAGRYTFAGVQEGTYTVTATASGYAGQSQTASVIPGTATTQNFSLTPNPSSLSGTVTDSITGQPISGASVSDGIASTTTDGTGHFAFAGLAEGSYAVTVSAAGYTTQVQTVAVPPGSAITSNFALIPNPGTISGTVLDSGTQKPINGATVSYSGGSVTTNAQGQYSLTGVTEGSYTLSATAGGYGTQSQTIIVGPGATVSQNFALVANPGTITGTVTDANTNQPIAGATVSFGIGSVSTDANGHYSATNLPPATYTVSAAATGYTTQSQTVSVGANATVTQNFALTPLPGAVSGTVIDATANQPVNAATVSYAGGTATTNAQGQYTLTGVVEGTYTLTASATNYGSVSSVVTVGPGGSVVQNFALAPNPGSISGTVTDAGTAQPVSGATVSYSGGTATTNAQGQYSLTGVSEGTYVISVSAAGYTSASSSVVVAPGAAVTQNVALTTNRGSITGSVTDAVTSQPIVGASVALSGGGTATTDASGHYALSGIVAGPYTLTASATNYAGQSQSVTVSAGSTLTQNFALTPNRGTISGTVTDASTAQPVSGATVSYSGGSAATNAQGQYSLTGVSEGTYVIGVAATGYTGSSSSVPVGPGGTVIQNFSLAPQPGTIAGTVTDSVSKQPIGGATVSYSGGSTTTNAQGQYTLSAVSEGSYSVTTSATNYASVSSAVTVGPGGSVVQNVALAPSPGSISGAVTDASTKLFISGATVSYSGGSTTTNAQGQYSLTGVVEGSYTVTATATGYGTLTQTVTVGAGAAVTQNFALSPTPGSIVGTVTSATTTLAVSAATITTSGGSTTTNASGQYTISNVPPGSYTLSVNAAGYQSQSKTVTVNPGAATSQNVALALAPVFSDGFESGAFSNWSGVIGLKTETTSVHTGTYAAEGNTTNGQTHAYKLLGTAYQNLYYRTYFEVKSQGASFTLMGVQASSVSLIAHIQMANNGKLQLINDIAHGSTMGPAVSLNTWHSLELHVIVSGTSSTIEVWLDGSYVSNFATTSANLGTAGVDEVRLGNLGTGPTYDLVFDDVAVDTVRVGQ